MRVLVFAPYGQCNSADLEIIQRHLDDGDEVIHLHCDGTLMTCDVNQRHKLSSCLRCIKRRKIGLTLLSAPIPSIPFLNLTPDNLREIAALPKKFDSLSELKAFKIENFDIGCAVLSSLISWIRDPYPSPASLGPFLPRSIVAAFSVYRSIQNHLDQYPADRVYVFNGRFAPCRATLRACQNRNTICYVYEIGNSHQHYALWENTMPHDLTCLEKEIRQHWCHADGDPQREKLAARFYIDRAKNIVQLGPSFTKDQQEGLLPRDWNSAKKNLVIFNSSEDEFAAVGDEYQNPLYTDQLEGLKKIIHSLRDHQDTIHIYLRTHPNLQTVDNADIRALLKLHAKHFTLITPDAPINTYALVRHADIVITFGSTVGIEAVYWGKPSILAGKSAYRNLGATYNPHTHEELINMAVANLEPKDKIGALMYSYFLSTYGIPYKYYISTGPFEGFFNGVSINPKPTMWKRVTFRMRTFSPYRWFFMPITRLRVMKNFKLPKELQWLLGGRDFGEFD